MNRDALINSLVFATVIAGGSYLMFLAVANSPVLAGLIAIASIVILLGVAGFVIPLLHKVIANDIHTNE